MNAFTYTRAADVAGAVREIDGNGTARFIAGGTNLVDLMKEDVERPARLVDITHLPLREIEPTDEGGLRLGALATNTAVAYHPEVERRYPLLAQAILAGASPQLRNMATIGGNLMQRTRCVYFYDVATACNKRTPGAGCAAIGGFTRYHAILGASPHCIAVHPSDMCVALAALDAVVRVTGPRGTRTIPFADFHRLPGDTPHLETNKLADELITAVDLPAQGFAEHAAYLKVRDRASYAFALVSVAAVLRFDGDTIREARLALGGVAHVPWRDRLVEELLPGETPTPAAFQRAADALVRDARGFGQNSFKIDLVRRAVVRALGRAAAGRRP
jgi:xanthine dehydrogenase YagS FAD-binding subunit